MSLQAARQTVARNPCAGIAATVGTVTALILWGASQVGLDMPLWVGAALTGFVTAGALSFNGLVPIWHFITYGRTAQPPD